MVSAPPGPGNLWYKSSKDVKDWQKYNNTNTLCFIHICPGDSSAREARIWMTRLLKKVVETMENRKVIYCMLALAFHIITKANWCRYVGFTGAPVEWPFNSTLTEKTREKHQPSKQLRFYKKSITWMTQSGYHLYRSSWDLIMKHMSKRSYLSNLEIFPTHLPSWTTCWKQTHNLFLPQPMLAGIISTIQCKLANMPNSSTIHPATMTSSTAMFSTH